MIVIVEKCKEVVVKYKVGSNQNTTEYAPVGGADALRVRKDEGMLIVESTRQGKVIKADAYNCDMVFAVECDKVDSQ